MIKTYDSWVPWPHLILMAGVHGDEPSGRVLLNDLLAQFESQKPELRRGKLTLIPEANPKAVALWVRQLELNLNRCFLDNPGNTSYEHEIARGIIPYLQKADYLIDLHDSTSEDTIPFLISEHEKWNPLFPVSHVVSGLDHLHPWGSDGYMNQIGKKWFCLECGYLGDTGGEFIAKSAVQNVLISLGMVVWESAPLLRQKHYHLDYIYHAKSAQVTLAESFQDFHFMKQGETIWWDWEEEILAPYDGVILFAREASQMDEEVFVFGKRLIVQ